MVCKELFEMRDECRDLTWLVAENRGVTGAYRLGSLCLRRLSAEMTLRHSRDSLTNRMVMSELNPPMDRRAGVSARKQQKCWAVPSD